MSNTENPPLSEAACLIVELAERLKVQNLKDSPGPWVYRWPGWAVAANGHVDIARIESDGLMEVDLHPYHFAVWKNGCLWGLMTPFSGTFMGLNGTGEDEFIKAIKARIKTLMPPGSRQPSSS